VQCFSSVRRPAGTLLAIDAEPATAHHR